MSHLCGGGAIDRPIERTNIVHGAETAYRVEGVETGGSLLDKVNKYK